MEHGVRACTHICGAYIIHLNNDNNNNNRRIYYYYITLAATIIHRTRHALSLFARVYTSYIAPVIYTHNVTVVGVARASTILLHYYTLSFRPRRQRRIQYPSTVTLSLDTGVS